MTRHFLTTTLLSLLAAISFAPPTFGQCDEWTVPSGGSFGGNVDTLESFQGDVYAGGEFSSIDGQPVNLVARWDGEDWSPLGFGIEGLFATVRTMKSWNGDLYVGGTGFEAAGGNAVRAIARWNGTEWNHVGITSGTTLNNWVWAMTEWEGDLIVGGIFSPPGLGTVVLARWNGTNWSSFAAVPAEYGYCYALTSFAGRLIGSFRNSAAPIGARDFIAAWDGEEWQMIGAANEFVSSLTNYGGYLIAGGSFTTIDDLSFGCIAKWDGSAWSPMDGGVVNPGAPGAVRIRDLAVYNGELIAAGRFDEIGDITNAKGIAAWNATSQTWRHYRDEFHWYSFNTVYESLLVHEGYLLAGGSFLQLQNQFEGETVLMVDGCVPCCVGGSCFVVSGSFCLSAGGIAGHALDTCDDGCTLGTCCLPWGCEAWLHADCIEQGGQFLGTGVSCNACPPGNDWCIHAFEITCGEIVTGNTSLATWDAAPFCVEPNSSAGVWYRLTGDGQFVFASLCNAGTTYDTRLNVYTDGCGTLTCVTGNDATCPGYLSQVTFFAEAGVEYLILVHGYILETGAYELSIQCSDLVTAPEDAISEEEPCGSNTVNNGCNDEFERFSEIRLGGTVHGNVWAANGTRDTDWYYLDLLEPTTVHLSAVADLPFRIGIIGGKTRPGSGACDGDLAFAHTVAGDSWSPLQLSAELEAGTWMIWAGANVFNGYPCETFNTYVLSATCAGCPDPIGACCLDGECLLLTEDDCATSRGVYLGRNTSCCDCPSTTLTPSLSILIRAGDTLSGYGEVTNIEDVAVNDNGEWIARVAMDSGQRVLVRNGLPWLASGDAIEPAPSTITSFTSASGFNNAGLLAMNIGLAGGAGSGVYLEGEPLIMRDEIATSPQLSEGTPWIGFFHTRMNDHGHIRLIGTVTDPGLPGTVHRAVTWVTPGSDPGVLHQTTIFKRYDRAPGMPDGVTFGLFGTSTGGINNRNDVLITASFEDVLDGALYLNRRPLHRRGEDAPIPGLTLSDLGTDTASDLNDSRDYMFRSTLGGAAPGTNAAIIRNGSELIARLGDPVPGADGQSLTSFGSGPLFLSNDCRGFWFGRWADGGAALFADNTPILIAGESVLRDDLVTVVGATSGLGGAALGFDASDNGQYVIARTQLNDTTPAVVLVHLAAPVLAPPCPADLSDDGTVDLADLLQMLSVWGPCSFPDPCPADLNDDDLVNLNDLLELLNAWGPCDTR